MKRLSLFVLALSLIVLSCSERKTGNVCEIRVSDFHERRATSPTEIYGNEPVYIKLQNHNDPVFALKGIKTVKIRDSLVYILDKKQKRICVFGMDGTPEAVLDYLGRGPQEYLSITDFDVDHQNNIWIVDGQKDMLFKYSSECELVASTAFPFDIAQIHCIDDGSFIVKLSIWDHSKLAGTALLKVDSVLHPVKRILDYPVNRDSDIEFESSLSSFSDGIFYNDQLDRYLYHIIETGDIESVFFFDFGPKAVREEYRKNIEPNLDRLNDCAFIFRSYRVTTDYITCGIRSKEWYGAILDRVKHTISYFEHDTSGFILAGQCAAGPIWQVTAAAREDSIPADVYEWLASGGDVLAVYKD